jgi:hypothetical protein
VLRATPTLLANSRCVSWSLRRAALTSPPVITGCYVT